METKTYKITYSYEGLKKLDYFEMEDLDKLWVRKVATKFVTGTSKSFACRKLRRKYSIEIDIISVEKLQKEQGHVR